MPEEKEYLTGLAHLSRLGGGNFYFVELSADLETRLERNATPHRMEMKASKKDVAWSRAKRKRIPVWRVKFVFYP